MNRKEFLSTVSLSMGSIVVVPGMLKAMTDKPGPFAAELVKEFVGAGHNDLEKVKLMLKENPNLIYAIWDWGGGDFESALEGAGHVGDKDIANYLISMGSRPNIFVLTMLGKTKIVKPLLEEYPELLHSKGPHGFTLLHHAERGGDEAAELFQYLEKKGLTEKKISLY
jgi:hypothetical protein